MWAGRKNTPRNGQRGVTLIEVLVALAILGFVAAGALTLISQNSRFMISVEDRLAASVLADNLMVERLVSRAPYDEGEEEFDREFAGRAWRCDQRINNVPNSDLVRIEIDVRAMPSRQLLATVTTLQNPNDE